MNSSGRNASDADFELCDSAYLAVVDHYRGAPVANKLSTAHRAVLLTWHAMGIIDNGGFQYLFEGDFEGDPGFTLTAQAFEEIGCSSAAEAVRNAIALFPNGKVIPNIDKRLKHFQSTSQEERDQINRKFWKASDVGKGEICVRLAEYIRNHPSKFEDINVD